MLSPSSPPSALLLLLLMLSVTMRGKGNGATVETADRGSLFQGINTSDCDRIAGRCAPYVVILGAAKCGTNALRRYLQRYPGIRYLTEEAQADMAKRKGWAGEVNWPWATASLDNPENQAAYAAHFPNTDWNRTFAVDKSTGYLTSAAAAEGIRKYLPRAKLIATLCDPTRRVWSDLNQWYFKVARDRVQGLGAYTRYHECRLFTEHMPGEALRQLEQLHQANFSLASHCPPNKSFKSCSICGFLRASMYAEHVQRYRESFGSHFYILDGDRLRRRPRETITELVNFLGWDLRLFPSWKHLGLVNSHKQKSIHGGGMPTRVRRILNWLLRPSFLALQEYLQKDFEFWQIGDGSSDNLLTPSSAP